MSIGTQLEELAGLSASLTATKEGIKAAIEGKGQEVGSIPLSEYPARIEAIVSGGGGDSESGYYLECLELTPDGFAVSKTPIEPGQVVTLKAGVDVPESNAGTARYVPAMVFKGWACPLPVTDNTITIPADLHSNVQMNAFYDTATGRSYFVLDMNPSNSMSATSLTTQINIGVEASGMDGNVFVDWGDGTVDDIDYMASTNTISHTFITPGIKILQIWTTNSDMKIILGGTYYGQQMFGNIMNIQNSGNVVVSGYLSNCKMNTFVFQNCSSLQWITLPENITSIEESSFNSCRLLTFVSIPDTITSIKSNSFAGCNSLKNIVIPNCVTEINGNVLSNCRTLKSIFLPNTIPNISNEVLSMAYNLESITIPDSVTSIKNSAFSSCGSLRLMVIPDSVINIEDSAFLEAYIHEYIFVGNTPPTLGMSALNSNNSLMKIYVPDDTVEIYKTAPTWTFYENFIYPISERETYHLQL